MTKRHAPATIVRAPKDRQNPYKMLRQATFEDRRLTWEERGVMAYLLVKPDDWEIQVSDLWRGGDVGRDKIYTILRHLEEYGYLTREEVRARGKFLRVRYLLYEEPLPKNQEMVDAQPFPENQETVNNSPLPEIPYPVLPYPVLPYPVNQDLTNNEGITKNEMNQKRNGNQERRNEDAAASGSDSFIRSLDADEVERGVRLLTDPEVGLDEVGARRLAASSSYDVIERHVFAWLAHQDRGYATLGALVHRIENHFNSRALTPVQKESELYRRYHPGESPRGDYLPRDYILPAGPEPSDPDPPLTGLAALWERCIDELAREHPRFADWLPGSRLEATKERLDGHPVYRVCVTQTSSVEWLLVKGERAIRRSISVALGEPVAIEIEAHRKEAS